MRFNDASHRVYNTHSYEYITTTTLTTTPTTNKIKKTNDKIYLQKALEWLSIILCCLEEAKKKRLDIQLRL